MSRTAKRELFLNALAELGQDTVTLTEVKDLAASLGIPHPQWYTKDETNRIGRGLYKVANVKAKADPTASVAMAAQVIPMAKLETDKRISNLVTDIQSEDMVPKQYKNYVPFGNFKDILSIVEANKFFPVFVTGHSGNGKTMSIEQACAKAKRKFVCVSMTPETDESDLLGNFVLIDGQMIWRDGPVTVAAREGAVLCIDEIDYGAQNLSCLQRVLEGKPFMLKKKGEVVTPAQGFTVFATANTKGKGSDDGRYMFTNVLNEAFLERFHVTMEQTWPSTTIEKKIIRKELASVGREDDDFADKLVSWAEIIRKTFDEGGCDEVISTRRLVHICQTFGVFGNRVKAIQLCLNRFDEDTKTSFMDLYTKVDADALAAEPKPAEVNPTTSSEEIPF